MNCLCLKREEGQAHIEDCPHYVAFNERMNAITKLNLAFSQIVTPKRFEDKLWVESDKVLDCLNKFKQLMMQNPDLNKIPLETNK